MAKICDVLAETEDRADVEREQYISDLSVMLALPEGARVFKNILADLGIGRPLGERPEDVAFYNLGKELMDDISIAAPGQALNILRELFCPVPVDAALDENMKPAPDCLQDSIEYYNL